LWLPAAILAMSALLLGIVALQAKHSWSWATSIVVLWLLGGLWAALGTFVVDEVELHSNASAALLFVARVFIVVSSFGLPTYMTFVPRVRRRFRERARLLGTSRAQQAKR
jgi:hypothetical protein